MLRPYSSLTVLRVLVVAAFAVSGIADLAGASRSPSPRWTTAAGIVWLLAAVLVAAYPGLALDALALAIGVALVAGGAMRLLAALRGRGDDRVAHGIAAVASVVFGALALSWPDVTLLVVAVVFGAKTFLFGCAQVIAAVRARRGRPARDERPRRRLHGWPRTVAMSLSLAAALALVAVSAALHRGEPRPDTFYQPPAAASAQPGALLRAEPFTRAVPSGAEAWRILYTTTRDDGMPATASGIVLASRTRAAQRPVIAWAHGTTGYESTCAPSLLKNPFEAGALPALDQILANDWVLVATDYTGLGTKGPHPYLIGQGEARSVLDAVRAARQLSQVSLADKTVVWGHSQGGHAALWTGQIQPAYAPDVPLAGVAALAPASDLTGLVSNLATVPGGSIFASYVVAAYTATYPDVSFDAVVRPEARAQVRGYAERCLAEPEVFVSITSSLLADQPIFSGSPVDGTLGSRLKDNTPTAHLTMPLLLAQGESDPLVLPAVQTAFVSRACANGAVIDYRTYPGRDHVGVVAPDSALIPDLVTWTKDRIDGKPAPDACP